MDDDWGYPYFRKPTYINRKKGFEDEELVDIIGKLLEIVKIYTFGPKKQ